jgi:hypothetical protein
VIFIRKTASRCILGGAIEGQGKSAPGILSEHRYPEQSQIRRLEQFGQIDLTNVAFRHLM